MDFAQAMAVLQARSSSEVPERPTLAEGQVPLPLHCEPCDETGQPLSAQQDQRTASQPLPDELASLRVGALLRLFFDRQGARAAVYNRFEEGFALFLRVTEAAGYQELVKRTTAEFAAISEGVNRVESALRAHGGPATTVADSLRAMQGLEREKLQLTAQLHILRHGLAIDELECEGDSEAAASTAARTARLRAEEAAQLRARLGELTAELNDALDEVRAELADGEYEEEEEEEEEKEGTKSGECAP
jgi:hypothetical protein